ncbi:protein transport protein Sec16B isoform X1 [Acyrthosiphon pisum]|uniref:Sec16 Sec23-binding domain-containing protein n=1 Tax=Acyrthosiphon pisum TaxID=7029 RepID=A0A8R2A880_ACYPI|nr:protein transport protein Sec16B isoform X1 [Acyrthosiphon pisum]|eukprot:XP_003241201.1 PREDICTED: protein transport protein Sec16B [Acyrthosiphon pisum]
MSNNNFWGNLDSYSNLQQQPAEPSQPNDEWSCSTDDWNYIDQSSTNKNTNQQKFNSTLNSDLTQNRYSVPDTHNGTTYSLVNSNRPTYNYKNGIEDEQHSFPVNNGFEKPESQFEQITNVQNTFVNQNTDNKKSDNINEIEYNFWADVENSEILPPASFQNESLQLAMNNLQISNEVIHSNVYDNNVIHKDTEITKMNSIENDDDIPPVGLRRLVTGQTKSFEDYSNPEPCGPQPFDVRTVLGQLSDDDIPVKRQVTRPQIGARPIDNNSNFQSIDNNSITLKRLPSLEQYQNQFEGHSRQVIHRDVEDFVNQANDSQKLDDSARNISDIDSFISTRNESKSEIKEPTTVIKKSCPKNDRDERTGPDGYMNESSPYLRSTTQNQIKPIVDSQQDNSLKLTNSTQSENNEKFQVYDRNEKRVEKKHSPPPPEFCRMVEGNIGEDSVQKLNRVPKTNQKNDERQRRHSIDSDSSVPLTNPVSEEGLKIIRRGPQQKKYNKNLEHYHNRDRRHYRHPRESEEDYFYEEEEENASLSPEIEPEYRSHRSRNHPPKRYRQRIPNENYDHSDTEYQSEYDEYDRRRRYRSPESDRYRRPPRSYRDRRYQDEISGQYYRREDYRNRPSSRTDSDYHRRYSPVPFQDYSAHIEMLDPLERRSFLLKFRENNPKAYTEWYTNYKAKVEMQKLISRTKNGSECSTPVSNTSHDVGSLNHMARLEKENHRTTPPRYQKYHVNAKMNMGFGKLYVLDSSKATIDVFKAMPESDDLDTAELFRFPTPFVLGKTHKNAVAQYLNKLADEATNNSERLLYELICMITKRNGIVDGTDVSELLMDNVAKFPVDCILFDNMSLKDSKGMSVKPLNNFRELLLQGNKSEALEFAVLHQDWGFAFILALYMDSKTLNYVRSKYFQTIPQNDTLQTFFQLSSGNIPSCTTCCTDNSWGDWREHLAMILSNQQVNINNARNATIQLGDTLNAKGDVFGAHFCYLAIQIPLESIGLSSKFTLLGTSSDQVFNTMATNRAILLTSAYEFSMRLNLSHFQIPSLLPYKYLLAIRLAEYGECENALHHLEAIATQLISSPELVNLGFVANVVELSTDLHYTQVSNNNLSGCIDALDWLEELKRILTSTQNNYNSVEHISPIQQIDNYQSHQTEYSVVPNEQQTVPDSSIDYSINYQAPLIQAPPIQAPPIQVPPIQAPTIQAPTFQAPPIQAPLQIVQQPSTSVNPYWQPNVVSQSTELPLPPQNEYSQYYDPTSMIMTTGEIASHNNPNEMTSEISTIAPDLTLMAEPENTISTEPKFGFFDRQMAELEPKVGTVEKKSPKKNHLEDKRQQKEKNSWLGGLTKFWKPSNNIDSIGQNFGAEEPVQQAAPPLDSELQFNPVANSSPANQNQNQFKIQRKRGVKDMYVNVMSNSTPSENILSPDPIFQTNQTPTTIYNPSQ